MSPGWLGAAYPWVLAAHIIFVIFWMAGMFMLPRFLVYQMASPVGSPQDLAWNARNLRLRRIILNPAMGVVWLLGLALAFNYGFAGAGWLHVKILLVLLLSGFHGWAVGVSKTFAAGQRPYAEKTLRLMNEVPSLATVAIVLLAVVKPF